MHRPTSLEVTVRTHRMGYWEGEPEEPDETIFNETITDVELVHDVQEQLDGLQRGVRSGTAMASTTYIYIFRFAINGVTTQVYWGNILCPTWYVTTTVELTNGESSTTDSVAGAPSAQLYGYNLMITLHKKIGMPLPDWWTAILPVPETDG
jgi:hypothetical protein